MNGAHSLTAVFDKLRNCARPNKRLYFTVFLALVGTVLLSCGRDSRTTSSSILQSAAQAGPRTNRVTFVQWNDLHLFDAGLNRSGEGVDEEGIDNRLSLHWAVLETNRLVLAEHRTIDFVVITGDFGLENVRLADNIGSPPKKCACPRRKKGFDGPIQPVSIDAAASETARELDALLVKRVYLVPGESDLCNADPGDLHRWAEFVLAVQASLAKQKQERVTALDASFPQDTSRVQSYDSPAVVDLTFTVERLYEQKDPRILALLKGQSAPPSTPHEPPSAAGIYLIGLNSAYFAPHSDPTVQAVADKAIKSEIDFVSGQIVPGRSHLIFMSVPDLPGPGRDPENIEPEGVNVPDDGSSWKLPKTSSETVDPVRDGGASKGAASAPRNARDLWRTHVLGSRDIIAVFAGGFHTSQRDIYPHNFNFAKKSDPLAVAKFWVAPPLSVLGQWRLPPEKVARGMLLVTVGGDEAIRASRDDAETVNAMPIWFSTMDQKDAAADDDKFAEARAYELDGKWDLAATRYEDALRSPDVRTRATASRGYDRARLVTRTWWWEIGYYFPPLRWAIVHPVRAALVLPVALALLLLIKLLRELKVFALLTSIIKFLIIPAFRGHAVMNTPVEMTKGAPAEEFGAQIQAATEEIRQRLLREQENWAARQISLLAPASSSLDQVVASIPDVQKLKVGDWFKFLVKVAQLFRWSVDCGLAVFGAPQTPPTSSSTQLVTNPIPPGGQLSAYAVLQWSLFVKNSWRQTITIKDSSSKADLARTLAELILGEAFAGRRR
jgi:hypothetical protein